MFCCIYINDSNSFLYVLASWGRSTLLRSRPCAWPWPCFKVAPLDLRYVESTLESLTVHRSKAWLWAQETLIDAAGWRHLETETPLGAAVKSPNSGNDVTLGIERLGPENAGNGRNRSFLNDLDEINGQSCSRGIAIYVFRWH